MNGTMDPPSTRNLLQELERAVQESSSSRQSILAEILASNDPRIVKKVPELVGEMSAIEIEMIYEWAEGVAARENAFFSNNDFACFMMVKCGVTVPKIMAFLRKYTRHGRYILDKIEDTLQNNRIGFDQYLKRTAERLITYERVRDRDRGYHILISIAITSKDWIMLAERLSGENGLDDLRQRVLERFLLECADRDALAYFCDNVIEDCFFDITEFRETEGPKKVERVTDHVTARMHWLINCALCMIWEEDIEDAIELFEEFGNNLPESVRKRIEPLKN